MAWHFVSAGAHAPHYRSADGKLLPTATLVRLEMPDDWSALTSGCAQLVTITRPRNLVA